MSVRTEIKKNGNFVTPYTVVRVIAKRGDKCTRGRRPKYHFENSVLHGYRRSGHLNETNGSTIHAFGLK